MVGVCLKLEFDYLLERTGVEKKSPYRVHALMIKRPQRFLSAPQRSVDCELRFRLLELLSDAYYAGWGKLVVLAAMNRIAEHEALELNSQIKDAVANYFKKFAKKA
jgi:hypothetical protein